MLTFWFLICLLALVVIGAIASVCGAVHCNSPGLGILAGCLILFAALTTFQVVDVAAKIDHIQLEKKR